MGIDPERVIAYGVKEPRKLESDLAQERTARNVDRQVIEEDAVLNQEDMTHYENEHVDVHANSKSHFLVKHTMKNL